MSICSGVLLNNLIISVAEIKQVATSYGRLTFIPVLQNVIEQSSIVTCAAWSITTAIAKYKNSQFCATKWPPFSTRIPVPFALLPRIRQFRNRTVPFRTDNAICTELALIVRFSSVTSDDQSSSTFTATCAVILVSDGSSNPMGKW